MGWTVDALWAAARVSWGSPHIWPEAQVPFPGEFIPPAMLSPRLPDCGSSTSAGIPSAASRMGVGALPGAFPWKGDRDCRKPGEIANLTLSSGRGPGKVSPQMRRMREVDVDPAVAPPCAHRARSHEAKALLEKLPHYFPIPVGQFNSRLSRRILHRRLQLVLLTPVQDGGEPPVCSKTKPWAPPQRKLASQFPMV